MTMTPFPTFLHAVMTKMMVAAVLFSIFFIIPFVLGLVVLQATLNLR